MEFHWNHGCLPKQEWEQVANAVREIRGSMMVPSLGGFFENGIDYCAVDFISEPQDFKKALAILNDLAKTLPNKVTYECKYCGALIEFEAEDFNCNGSFHPDGEELLWEHIQFEHEDVFEEVKNLETPYMIEECYD